MMKNIEKADGHEQGILGEETVIVKAMAYGENSQEVL